MQFKDKLASILLLFVATFFGCQSTMLGALQGTNNYLQSRRTGQSNSSSAKLMLFGGKNNNQYLGCLNCSKFAIDSILNEYGKYGNGLNSVSIWNSYGTYGSKYSQYSPWNPYATAPPVIVDESGNFYGYFTVNRYFPNRTRISWIIEILEITKKAIK